MEDKKRLITFILFVIMALLFTWILLPTFSFAKESSHHVQVSDAWAKPTLIGRDVGVAYVTLENLGSKGLTLVSAETEVAERAEIHTHIHNENGTMQMRQLERLEILPNATQTFEPGGLHLMLFGLKQPLKAGQKFTVTLKFDDASSQQVEATVRANG